MPRHRGRRHRGRRHRGRRYRGRRHRPLPRAGARLARGRPPPTSALAVGAAATPRPAVAAAPTRRARVLREQTRPRRPPRIQRRHDPLFENSKRTSPTRPPEPDSGQLPRSCDVMAVRGRFHLPPRPRKHRICQLRNFGDQVFETAQQDALPRQVDMTSTSSLTASWS